MFIAIAGFMVCPEESEYWLLRGFNEIHGGLSSYR